jgi:nitric oxide reductase subunit B
MTDGALPEKADRQALPRSSSGPPGPAATNRPGESDLSYTSNWPHEPLVGNTMSTSAAMWSMVSIILLLAGIAAMLWLQGGQQARGRGEGAGRGPAARAPRPRPR